MNFQVIRTSLMSIGLGFLMQMFQSLLGTDYLTIFLSKNLITILISLMAINSATMGIVLSKIRDLVDKYGHAHLFSSTKQEMILAIKEQICLIMIALVILTVSNSEKLYFLKDMDVLIYSLVNGIFIYSLFILYDIAKGVLVIIDFDNKKIR